MGLGQKPKHIPKNNDPNQLIDIGQFDSDGNPIIMKNPNMEFGEITIHTDNTATIRVSFWEVYHKQHFRYNVTNLLSDPIDVNDMTGEVEVTFKAQIFNSLNGHPIFKQFKKDE